MQRKVYFIRDRVRGVLIDTCSSTPHTAEQIAASGAEFRADGWPKVVTGAIHVPDEIAHAFDPLDPPEPARAGGSGFEANMPGIGISATGTVQNP